LAGAIATGAMAVSLSGAMALAWDLVHLPEGARAISVSFFNWMAVGSFRADWSFVVDPISAIMILVITGVGLLIHVFSIGYMGHDERPAKYFAYLNFFVFNMLLLVLGDNLLVMFVGWEGVGLASYLLIGFWFKDGDKAKAGMKAFITNRIGDAGLLLGIFLLFVTFETVNFQEIIARLPQAPELSWLGPLTLACLFLFVGATGKSAQIPLYVWLPDAMAGPTPVSALIHAATMVTAGIYMIARLNPLFFAAPNALLVVAWVGALTAVVAATIGLLQNDIKKILAYSTVSQLGYMFLGLGVGAVMPAMFHLMTHAFFKALMFLGSGSVIHGMHEEQDIRKMGALRKLMPITHITFLIGWLAIIGVPPFAGFFSKDEILYWAFAGDHGHLALWMLGFVGAGLTAFYMTRLMCLVFWGQSRVEKGVEVHEAPPSMWVPLALLALLSTVGGWIGIPHALSAYLPGHPPHLLEEWLKPVIASNWMTQPSKSVELALMGASVSLALIATFFAYFLYILRPDLPAAWARRFQAIHQVVSNKYWVDEIYDLWIIRPLVNVSQALWAYVDVNFIDRLTYWISDYILSCARGLRAMQSGRLQTYAMYIALGLVITISLVLEGS
jgi:NADH-quinone oxidoreductase subunit L